MLDKLKYGSVGFTAIRKQINFVKFEKTISQNQIGYQAVFFWGA